jgi:FkbM family methyltransferase
VTRRRFDRLRLIQKQINERPRLREWLTRLLHGARELDVVLFKRKLRVNALRENGYYRAARLAHANSLLRDETLVMQRVSMMLGDGVTFVDVGANIGIFSAVIADAQRLFRDAERFGFEAVNVALAAEEGTLDFATGAVSGIATRRDLAGRAHIAGRGFTVAARRLDSFDLPGRLVIKIDVEQMELEVLEGARGLFEAGRVAAVYLDEFDDKQAVLDFLSGYGFDLRAPARLKAFAPGRRALFAIRRDR